MSFKRLEEFEAQRAAEKAAQAATKAEVEAQRKLKKTVEALIPKSARAPKRPPGRRPVGGLSRSEVKKLKEQALRQLTGGPKGLQALEAEVQHIALVILKIDGVLGTEPWRGAGSPHGGIIAANARVRYLENAARLLDDLRRARGVQSMAEDPQPLLEGVIDAEPVEEEPRAADDEDPA